MGDQTDNEEERDQRFEDDIRKKRQGNQLPEEQPDEVVPEENERKDDNGPKPA